MGSLTGAAGPIGPRSDSYHSPIPHGANGASGPSSVNYPHFHAPLSCKMMDRPAPVRRSIADAYSETFPRGRSVADFLHEAMERVRQSPVRELTLTAGELRDIHDLGISGANLERIAKAKLALFEEARKRAEPITVESMKAAAERVAYEEIYDVYRHRKEPEGDRLLDVTDRAENLEQACAKLIGLSGLSAEEVEEHELAQFDAGSISELCDRLEELTGDSYSFSNFETPAEDE